MLSAQQLDKYADVLLWGLKTARTGEFKENDIILLQYDPPALKLAEILYSKILDMGMNPVQRMGVTSVMEYDFYKKSSDGQVTFIAPGDRELYESINGRIFLRAPESLTHLKDIDSMKIGKALVARKPLRDIMDDREAKGLYSWTLCTVPTPELAKQAKTNLKTYTDQIIKACYLDKRDPVGEWNKILQDAGSIKEWLNSLKVKFFLIESRNMSLKITPGEKRKWKGVSGHNIPSFELFFSPDWRGTEGEYYSNLPSFKTGNYVDGVRLVFKNGNVVKLTAKKGEDFALKQIKMDEGASRVGEFSLTDKRFSKINRFMADTLFDENFGGDNGNCHIAVGKSYTDTYDGDHSSMTKELENELGFNDSALHWDLVNTEDKTVAAVLADGKKLTIYENGMFKY
jgi:aminopeptidase